ncbi:MAG: hypothetical protein JWN68_3437 [Nocardioides sp.]|uniref:hypothetical protein n=1 Tax=Nocardioides sp. TaxID=35761 RepID=UPI002624DE8F|nr:hypothetical protein [Nocardioides sp.]MCW2835484.1 hypothetical protein [Nocardioides sp.]
MPHDQDDELRFRPTSGLIMGSLAMIGVLVVAGIALADPGELPAEVVSGAVLVGVLGWATMLWPRLSVTSEDLVMRNVVETVRLPLAAIEALAVRQVLAVRAGDKRYVSPALGRSWRKAMVGDKPATRKDADLPITEVNYVDYVEKEIRDRMEQARATAGVTLLSDEQLALAAGVRRRPAWLPIVLIVASVLALVASFLL